MTKEELIQAISDDKMMPFIQPEQLANIVEFVIKNYHPSLPSNLYEAADAYSENILANGEDMFDAIADGFRAGAEWMAEQGVSKKGEVFDNNEFIKFPDGTFIDLDPSQALIPAFNLNNGDKVVVQIRKK